MSTTFNSIGNSVLVKGDNVTVKPFSVIGMGGFRTKKSNFKVILEDRVEIGSNCTVERGSFRDTKIGKNTKIDDHVHIAHDVHIGKNCIIYAGVIITDSVNIADNSVIDYGTVVTEDIV